MEQISELLKDLELTDVKATDKNGNTALHLAINNEKFTQNEVILILEFLLDSGVDPNIQNKKNETILQLAIKNRMKDVVDFLLTHTTDLNGVAHFVIQDEHSYCRHIERSTTKYSFDESDFENLSKHANFVEWLISKGLDFDRKNKLNESALFMAIKYNLQHILPTLLECTKDINFVDNTKNTLLHLFLKVNDKKNHRGINKRWYCNRYATDIVKILLDKGVSADAENSYKETPIEIAICNKEDIEVVELLLQHSKKVNHKDSEGHALFGWVIFKWTWTKPIKKHKYDYYMKVSRALIAKGAGVNDPTLWSSAPLSCAVRKNNLCLVEFLGENGADFSVTIEDGKTLMHLLVENLSWPKCNEETKKALFNCLITNGCKVRVRDKNGTTPLHVAAKHSNAQDVQMLIEHGASVNCKNNNMETPLHFAVQNFKSLEVVELLLKHGANVNAKDLKGQTVLHKVARANPEYVSNDDDLCGVLRILLQYGADVNTGDMKQLSVLSVVRSRNLSYFKLPPLNRRYIQLTQHSIKLKAANLPLGETINGCLGGFFEDYSSKDFCEVYYELCIREIQKLKCTFIDDRTSLYTLLHKDLNGRRTYVNNDELQRLVHSPELEKQFPEYSVLILANYHEALTRKTLLEPAKEAWIELTEINLPDICIECILSFLSNSDLFDIIEMD